jgi:dTDP-glucose 4,6-dehydratase
MKVFILGSNSFAGSSLANFLIKKKIKVYGFSRSSEPPFYRLPYLFDEKKNIPFYKLNFNKEVIKFKKILFKIEPDYIFDFYSQGMVNESWKNPVDWYQTNIISKSKLINILMTYKNLKKYIRISTPEVYGTINKKLSENLKIVNPSTPYALSHAMLDKMLLMYFKQFRFPVVFTRSSNFYGPGQQLYRLIPKVILSIKNKSNFYVDGKGKSFRNFIYSTDFCNAFYTILKKGKLGELYHVTGDNFYSVITIVKKIYKLMNVSLGKNIKFRKDRIGKDTFYKLNNKKLKKLGWFSKVKIDQGLKNTILWIEKYYLDFKKKEFKYNHKK